MWRRISCLFLAFFLQTVCLIGGALAQSSGIDCNSFLRNPDGSWTVVIKVFITPQRVWAREGTIFRPGQIFLGDDMAARLNKECPNQPVATPDAPQVPGQAVQPQPQVTYVPLSSYTEPNGVLDVERLSCGHLAIASPQEADLLLAWYSGWYSGFAKRRGINLARVQAAIRNVAAYCRINREKRLSDVMELMLK